MNYEYFVAYAHMSKGKLAFGRIRIETKVPIRYEDLPDIEKIIMREGINQPIVINFQLLNSEG